jgi:hypothetical protein
MLRPSLLLGAAAGSVLAYRLTHKDSFASAKSIPSLSHHSTIEPLTVASDLLPTVSDQQHQHQHQQEQEQQQSTDSEATTQSSSPPASSSASSSSSPSSSSPARRGLINKANVECVDCDILGKLQRKSYLRQNTDAQRLKSINILTIGSIVLPRFVCGECVDTMNFYKIDAAASREFECGSTRVLQVPLSPNQWDHRAEEEIGIRIRGECKWAKPMTPSGLFSHNVLGRAFGREERNASERPTAVIVSASLPCEQLDRLRHECQASGVPLFMLPDGTNDETTARLLKGIVHSTAGWLKVVLVETWAAAAYDQGFAAGKGIKQSEVYAKAYAEAAAACEAKITKARADGYNQAVAKFSKEVGIDLDQSKRDE